jgi:hypothetical protein
MQSHQQHFAYAHTPANGKLLSVVSHDESSMRDIGYQQPVGDYSNYGMVRGQFAPFSPFSFIL